jgi:hypothetical protein
MLSSVSRTLEFDFLCSVARPKPDRDVILTFLRAGLDWERVLSFATAHGVRPQLIRSLRELDWVGTTTEVRQALLDFVQVHKARSLFLADQLLQVTEQLSRRNIRFATFKGPSLAVAVYGDLSLRECNDIDIIVDEQQVSEAERVLDFLGYKPVHVNAAFRNAFFSYQRQIALIRRDPILSIDLHWDFTTKHVPFPIAPEEIWGHLNNVQLAGRRVPTLGRSDLALFLAGHGTKEGWRCLGWVCDFAMLIEKHSDLDWAHLLCRARQKGCGRSFLLAFQLSAQLLQTRAEGDLLILADTSTQCRLAAEASIWRISNEFPTPSSERIFGDLELCEKWTQKVRVLTRLLIGRTVGDYNSMPLPRVLWRVYHITRPLRLVAKVVRRLMARSFQTLITQPGLANVDSLLSSTNRNHRL